MEFDNNRLIDRKTDKVVGQQMRRLRLSPQYLAIMIWLLAVVSIPPNAIAQQPSTCYSTWEDSMAKRGMGLNGPLKAGMMLQMDPRSRHLYIYGLIDGLLNSPFLGAPPGCGRRFRRCTANRTAKQDANLLRGYLRRNRREWSLPLVHVAMHVLYRACMDGPPLD